MRFGSDSLQGASPAGHRSTIGLGAALGVLVVLASQLPYPWAAASWEALSPGSAVGLDAADQAALLVGSAAVWAVTGWTALVLGAALAARRDGRLGVAARAALRWIAPAGLRTALTGIVSLTLVGGLAACSSGSPATGASTAVPQSVTQVAQSSAQSPVRPMVPSAPPSSVEQATEPVARCAARSTAQSGNQRPGLSVSAADPHPTRQPVTTSRATATNRAGPTDTRLRVDLDWPATGHSPAPHSHRASTSSPRTEVVVLRGDSLWSIAARHLPAGAGDAEIDASGRLWYSANRTVVGPDPDLILPGQRLLAPIVTERTS